LPNDHRDIAHYTCPRELLPVIESALAAEGYVVEVPLQRAVGGTRMTVMTRGGSVISLHEDAAQTLASIRVHLYEATGRLAILDELPRLVAPQAARATRR
jgi:hypothetical protein